MKINILFKLVCGILCFASFFIEGPIIPIISFIIAVALLVYKIKLAKESPERFADLMIDIVLVVIVIIVDIGFFVLNVSIENEFNKYNYSQSSSKEMKPEEFAETVIAAYKIGHLAQFSDEKNHQNAIRSGFATYLKDELGLTDITVKGNKIICSIGLGKVIFTITKNDIQYSVL